MSDASTKPDRLERLTTVGSKRRLPNQFKQLITVSLCMWITGAKAEMTGHDLKGYCEFYPVQTQATAACMGYVFGTLDTSRLMNKMFKGQLFCEPQRVTGDQIIAMTKKYLSDHPEELHLVAASLIFGMYTKAFPCKEKSN
jgi:hypothetical protein